MSIVLMIAIIICILFYLWTLIFSGDFNKLVIPVMIITIFYTMYYSNKQISLMKEQIKTTQDLELARKKGYIQLAISEIKFNLEFRENLNRLKKDFLYGKSIIPTTFSLLGIEKVLETMVVPKENTIRGLMCVRNDYISLNTKILMLRTPMDGTEFKRQIQNFYDLMNNQKLTNQENLKRELEEYLKKL